MYCGLSVKINTRKNVARRAKIVNIFCLRLFPRVWSAKTWNPKFEPWLMTPLHGVVYEVCICGSYTTVFFGFKSAGGGKYILYWTLNIYQACKWTLSHRVYMSACKRDVPAYMLNYHENTATSLPTWNYSAGSKEAALFSSTDWYWLHSNCASLFRFYWFQLCSIPNDQVKYCLNL